MNLLYTIFLFPLLGMIFEPKLGFTEIDIASKISDFQSTYNNKTNSSLFLVDNECYSKGGIII